MPNALQFQETSHTSFAGRYTFCGTDRESTIPMLRNRFVFGFGRVPRFRQRTADLWVVRKTSPWPIDDVINFLSEICLNSSRVKFEH